MTAMTKEAFSQLVVRYERLVYTICFQLVRDPEAAEDLTQDAFLSAYLHRDAMPAGYERQWLGRIAANKAKDYLQSAWNRRTVLPGDEGIPPGLAPPAEAEALSQSGAAEIADFAIVTTPKRRHKQRNFASLISADIAAALSLPFFEDCAFAPSKHRVGTVFTANNIPTQRNVIVFDDFVTTGQTLASMKALLRSLGKNTIFFAGINNKL